MEERLGRLGRPVTTVVVICVVLGIVSWALKLFWDNMVFPLYQFTKAIGQNSTPEQLLKEVATPLGVCVLSCVVLYGIFLIVLNKFLFKPVERRIKEMEAFKLYASEQKQWIEKAMLEVNKTANDRKE